MYVLLYFSICGFIILADGRGRLTQDRKGVIVEYDIALDLSERGPPSCPPRGRGPGRKEKSCRNRPYQIRRNKRKAVIEFGSGSTSNRWENAEVFYDITGSFSKL